ncbi:unnamed protein product [Sphacelaria rigidula]
MRLSPRERALGACRFFIATCQSIWHQLFCLLSARFCVLDYERTQCELGVKTSVGGVYNGQKHDLVHCKRHRCGLYKEKRDVLEGKIWEVNESVMKSFGTLHSSEKIEILGDRWHGRRRRNRKGIRYV